MAISGSSLPIVGKALGHSQPSTTAVYARLSVNPVQAAMTTAADVMLKAGNAAMEAGGIKLLQAEAHQVVDDGEA